MPVSQNTRLEEARSRFVIGLEVGGVSEDTIARFSASQLVGRLVDSWAQLLDVDLIPAALDFSTVPRGILSSSTAASQTFLGLDPMQYMFKTVKLLMQLPSKPPDSVSLRRFKLVLGDDLKRTVGIRDFHVEYGNSLVYENIHLLPGKHELQKH